MNKIRVLYVHGLGSSSESETSKYLSSLCDDYILFHPTFDVSPKQAYHLVNNLIEKEKIDIVIGTSIGGFYSLASKCKNVLVINPALTPINDIKAGVGYGEHQYRYPTKDKQTYMIDDSYFDELKSIVSQFGNNLDNWYQTFLKTKVIYGVFGSQDTYFSHYDDFKKLNVNKLVLVKDGHTLHQKNVIKVGRLLKEMIEMVKKQQ